MAAYLRQPEAFSLIRNQTVSDPFASYGDLPIPEYLDFGGRRGYQSNYLSFDRSSMYSYDDELKAPVSCLSFVTNETLNKHEQLFGSFLSCKDVKFYCLQFSYTGIVVCLAWSLICFIGYSLTAAYTIST